MASYTTFEDVDQLDTEWLWNSPTAGPRIPRGSLCVIFGPGAAGKGRLTWDLIGRITTGRPMPFCEQGARPGACVVIQPEDHVNEQQAKRLREAGADPAMVIPFTRLPGGERFGLSADTTHEGDAAQLRALVEELKADGKAPAAVVIDPIAAVVKYGSILSNAGVRRALAPLQDLAETTGVAVIVIAHEVSGGKLQGSMGFQQVARVVYRVSEAPENKRQKRLELIKGNDLPPLEDLRFEIGGDDGRVVLTWLDRSEIEERQRSWRTQSYAAVMVVSENGRQIEKRKIGRSRDLGELQTLCSALPEAPGPALTWRRFEKDGAVDVKSLAASWKRGNRSYTIVLSSTMPIRTAAA